MKRTLPQTTEALQASSGPSLAPSASSDGLVASCRSVTYNLVQRMTRPAMQLKPACRLRPC